MGGPKYGTYIDKEPKSGDAETDASSNNPRLTKNECSEYNNSTEIQDTNTTDVANNLTSSTHHRRNCTAQRNPEFFMDVKDGSLQNNKQRKVQEVPFKIYHQNIRSLRRKSHELLYYLYPNLPHIICLTHECIRI
jgi:hypothetical protein